MDVNITDAAKQQINDICIKYDKPFVRLSILAGGCNGFNKSFDFDTKANDDDLLFECYGGALLIDNTSLELLMGCTVDYVTDLTGSSFKVSIPTATSSCGCGNSFSI